MTVFENSVSSDDYSSSTGTSSSDEYSSSDESIHSEASTDSVDELYYVLHNPHSDYFSQAWAYLCGTWQMSDDLPQFLLKYFMGAGSEVNHSMKTVVVMPNEDKTIPDPKIFEVNDGRGACDFLFVFRPFESDSYFWQPDRIEYHNINGTAIVLNHLEKLGWILDERSSRPE